MAWVDRATTSRHVGHAIRGARELVQAAQGLDPPRHALAHGVDGHREPAELVRRVPRPATSTVRPAPDVLGGAHELLDRRGDAPGRDPDGDEHRRQEKAEEDQDVALEVGEGGRRKGPEALARNGLEGLGRQALVEDPAGRLHAGRGDPHALAVDQVFLARPRACRARAPRGA